MKKKMLNRLVVLLLPLMAAVGPVLAAVVDIPFWGQENPLLERSETAKDVWQVPDGYDFRVFSVCFSDVIGFYTGKSGIILLVR